MHADMQTISLRKRPGVYSELERNRRDSSKLEASIVAVGNVKGGVGRTTLAVNLATHQAFLGRDVLLVDGDEQGTSRAFTQLRAEKLGAPGYTAVSLEELEIRTQRLQLRNK